VQVTSSANEARDETDAAADQLLATDRREEASLLNCYSGLSEPGGWSVWVRRFFSEGPVRSFEREDAAGHPSE
jgi:hypothetical protein